MNWCITGITRLIFILIVFTVSGQSRDDGRGREPISIGHIDQVYSKVLEENRRIWIHLPTDYYESNTANKHYPVLFILDARSHFTAMAAMTDQLGEEIFWPKMIVVGIESTDRLRDLTPTKIHRLNELPESYLNNTGGAAKFLEFITEELIPHVDRHYPTTTYRSLVGHSLGGLFTTWAMNTGIQDFRNYVAIDPSYWWDGNYMVEQLKPYTTCLVSENVTFFLAAANTLPPGTSPAAVMENNSQRTAHYRAIHEYAGILDSKGCTNDRFTYRYYPENSHANVSLSAFYDAFSDIFNFYNIDPVLKQFDPDILHNISTEKFLNAFRSHYQNISRELGYKVMPEEDLISSMGYRSLELEDFEKAEALFRLNISNYPESARAYDSMGDYFLITERPYHAEKYYEKAVGLDRNSETIRKLQYLKQKQ